MTWTWVLVCGVLMFAVIIPEAQGFFGMRKGGSARNKRSLGEKGELYFYGGNLVGIGTMVIGVCDASKCDICNNKATSTSKTENSISDSLFIIHANGNTTAPKRINNTQKMSLSAIKFTIPRVHRSQFGRYICYYQFGGEAVLISTRTLYVDEPIVLGLGAGGRSGDRTSPIIAGTTVYGICNATGISTKSLKSNHHFPAIYRVIYYNSTRQELKIPEKQIKIKPVSQDVIGFEMAHVKKSQCCGYICRYGPLYTGVLISTVWLQVGEKPMKPFLNLTNQDAVLVYNWENLTIIISPTIDQQNAYTHDPRDTDVRLLTKCQIWFNWRCSNSMPFTKCDMDTSTNTCKVPRKVYRDLSGRKPPNYTCIKAECWNDAFGNSSAVYRVDLAQRVRPAPVPSITAAIVNSRTVKSSWKPDKKWRMFGGQVLYDIEFNAKQFQHQLTFMKLNTTSLMVSDLIPHGEYNVQITASPKYAGFESDPTASTVIMPPDVPAENPQLIATDIEQYGGGEKKVTLFWKKIPEIKRNGDITIKVSVVTTDTAGVQKRSLPEPDQLPADQIMYSYVLKDDKSYVIKLETMSTSLGRNTSLEPTTVQMERDHELSAPFVFVEAIRDQNDDYVNVTWEIPSEMDGEDVLIIYCEEGQDKECSKMSPLKTLTVPATKRLVRVDNGNIYKIGLVRPTPGKPGLVKWSRCIYRQNEVPTVPPNLNLRPEPKKVQVQVDEYPCEVTLAKVVRVEGMLCRTSNQVTCSGESRSINISEGEFSQPHFYPVDHPGSHYMVQAQAVSSSGGRSPEWTDGFVAPSDNQTDAGVIVGVGVGCLVVLVLVVAIIFGYRRYKKTKEAVKMKRTPAVKVDLHEDESAQCDQFAGLPRENPYEPLMDQKLSPALRNPDHNEAPPPLPPRDMNLSNSSNTSGGATGSNGFHSGAMATGEESGDEETGGMSSESAMDSSGCYAPGVVQIKISPNEMKKREIPMSVFKNDSACSEPSGSREDDISVPVDVKDDSSRGHPPCLIPDEAETEFNSRESFDANTSRDTDELGSTSAVGSSRDYAQVALADQPPPSVLPAIQDDFAIDFAPNAHAGPTQGEKSTPENVVEEQRYRSCGPRGLFS
ncbi:uncharacterized protein LOC135487275 isoform X3 [Lineus longissimus]|uniref:uncharacterized protein LOC135487275 isoform X3 n=1 Tax=Lineus longissimus TaxID=88925 RepID=UPI00315C4D69